MGVSSDCPNFLSTPYIISGTVKVTNFKVGRYIHRVHANKSPLKLGENGAWAYTGNAEFFEYPLLSQERVKLQTSNLAGIFTGSMRTKAH